jgi:hypothetical protein
MPPRAPDLLLERERMIGELRDLIAALDRRRPGAERGAEQRIARHAAALKRRVLTRLEQLRDTCTASR